MKRQDGNLAASMTVGVAPVPADRIVRKPEAARITGLSATTLWRLSRKDPTFPKPVRLTPQATGWFESELRLWLQSRRQNG